MDLRTCSFCRKLLKPEHRGLFCSRRCTWRAWQRRAVARGYEAQQLPLAALPCDAEAVLPVGPGRLRVAIRMALPGHAPAGARGYRLGIQQGLQLMRWFPVARFRTPPMFLLDPFEEPVVPREGIYAVVYLDDQCQPIGGPRFTIAVDTTDPRLLLSDGDRTYKPRPRW